VFICFLNLSASSRNVLAVRLNAINVSCDALVSNFISYRFNVLIMLIIFQLDQFYYLPIDLVVFNVNMTDSIC
jgi:hypothetical protein